MTKNDDKPVEVTTVKILHGDIHSGSLIKTPSAPPTKPPEPEAK